MENTYKNKTNFFTVSMGVMQRKVIKDLEEKKYNTNLNHKDIEGLYNNLIMNNPENYINLCLDLQKKYVKTKDISDLSYLSRLSGKLHTIAWCLKALGFNEYGKLLGKISDNFYDWFNNEYDKYKMTNI